MNTNKRIDVRSIATHRKSRLAVAACLILAAFALPLLPELARAGGNGNTIGGFPPQPVDSTPIFLSHSETGCTDDIYVVFGGKAEVIKLPGGGFIGPIGVDFTITLTNANEPSKTVTFKGMSGVLLSSYYNQHGDLVMQITGRTMWYGPDLGILLLVGDWTVVIDPNTVGQLVQEPTGTGTKVNVCSLIE
jgi:hypothetical protein